MSTYVHVIKIWDNLEVAALALVFEEKAWARHSHASWPAVDLVGKPTTFPYIPFPLNMSE